MPLEKVFVKGLGCLSSLSDVDFSVGIVRLEIFLKMFLLFTMAEHKFIVEFSYFPQFSLQVLRFECLRQPRTL